MMAVLMRRFQWGGRSRETVFADILNRRADSNEIVPALPPP
jgi:hypothetical protein